MAATSDGQQAIEVVIEKLQEIVDDIQNNKEQRKVKENGEIKTNRSSGTVKVERLERSEKEASEVQKIVDVKNSTQINIVPIAVTSNESIAELPKSANNKSPAHGTSVVITTTREKNPTQVVLNFPVDAGEFNIGDTQGLIETLQKLNQVLSKGKESGQKSLLTTNSGGQFTTEVQLYKCAKCDYWSHNKYYLKQHVDLVHNAERVYKCPFCDYAGKRSHSLKEHLVVHSNYRPHVCSQCNASFRKKGHLTNHIKMHSQFKGHINSVCPICMSNNFENLLALHIHLREMHSSEVYCCDICQYASYMNKGNITMHMLSHGNPKIYTCSGCTFTSLHQRIMEEHVLEEHLNKANLGEKNDSIHIKREVLHVSDGRSQSDSPKIWLKCSECGFSTNERDTLQDHMIAKHLHMKGTARGEGNGEKNVDSNTNHSVLGETDDRIHGQGAGSAYAQLSKVLDGPAPYRCTNCQFESSVSFSFITHMLEHRIHHPSIDLSLTDIIGEPQIDTSGTSNDTGSNQGTSSQAYKYDECNKWYQCTLCGYSSEHQRTIKAHIWKHSGHKDLDYPTFQNKKECEDPTAFSGKESLSCLKSTERPSCMSVASPGAAEIPGVANAGQCSASPKARALKDESEYVVVRICKQELDINRDLNEQIKEIIENMSVIPNEVVVYDSEADIGIQQKEEIDNDSKKTKPAESPKIVTEEHSGYQLNEIGLINKGSEFKFLDEPLSGTASEMSVSQNDSAEMKSEHNLSSIPEAESTEELKQTLSTPEMAVEISIQSQDDPSTDLLNDPFSVPSKLVSASKVDEATGAFIPTVVAAHTQALGAEMEASTLHADTSHDSSTDDDSSQMSGSYDSSDAEIITLLTLLKKGPNFNPSPSNTGGKLSKQRLEGIANAVREQVGVDGAGRHSFIEPGSSGISSSLLAVIEQLRERTNPTTVPGDDAAKDANEGSKKRKRRRAEEDIEKLINIEATESGVYKCLCCFYTHASLDNMRAHMRIHEAREPYQCSLCDFRGTCSEDLQEHMLQHCKTRSFQCKMCTAVFGYKSQLRAHMCAHKETKSFECQPGDFEGRDLHSLNTNRKTHDVQQKQVYMCRSCEFPFHSYQEISQHVVSCNRNRRGGAHESEGGSGKRVCRREYACDMCSYVAATQVLLKAHARSHDKEQNLQCTACGFLAHSIRSLKSHMKRHVNDQRFVEQPLEQYKCNLCGYVCHHLPSLKSHMWRHASDKNYNYEQINEIINRALEYDESSVTQGDRDATCMSGNSLTSGEVQARPSDEPPNYLILFRCCQCGYESVHKSLLNAHMKTHIDIIQKTLEVNHERLLPRTQTGAGHG